jgi:hypothetical protein
MRVTTSTNDLIRDALDRLASAEGELTLDFRALRRIEPGELQSLKELAGKADAKRIRVVLDAVSVDVYRVLILVNLAPRFTFRN